MFSGKERPLVEVPRWVEETKTSGCVSKHRPLSLLEGQELGIISLWQEG